MKGGEVMEGYVCLEAPFICEILEVVSNPARHYHGDPFNSALWHWGDDGCVYVQEGKWVTGLIKVCEENERR